ncbi:uncharacterized protein LOC121760623 [Salvia splendens]|uniref:uncharacterized protein LOC121760623 n=1 Tax=Salvia splendens TaxID=180675 RepID=UPI001C268AD2|nr:uncharacterized protein LOC121760623 [Salvia splendens]
MRVFKWSSDFDAYCESPIAAIWCNLIGLPIHLFDQSALFAIGKLLGNPIQVDRATATKTRLSFARICIEIDITKPPPEEIILDLCGRELVQQVRWDKIPSYCQECKHVGHTSDVCYAMGKKERPPKRNYNINPQKKANPEGHGMKGMQDAVRHNPNSNEGNRQGKNTGNAGNRPNNNSNGEEERDTTWDGPDIMGGTQGGNASCPGTFKVGLKRGGGEKGNPTPPTTEPPSPIHGDMDAEWEYTKASRSVSPPTRGSARGGARHAMTRGGGFFSKFDVDNCGEADDSAMDMQVGTERIGDGSPLDNAEEHATNKEQHLIEYQGGTSSPSGTHPTC